MSGKLYCAFHALATLGQLPEKSKPATAEDANGEAADLIKDAEDADAEDADVRVLI